MRVRTKHHPPPTVHLKPCLPSVSSGGHRRVPAGSSLLPLSSFGLSPPPAHSRTRHTRVPLQPEHQHHPASPARILLPGLA